jgi:hypothetical protein
MDNITLARAHHEWAAKQAGLRITPSGYMSWLQYVRVTVENAKLLLSSNVPPRSQCVTETLQALACFDVPPRYVSDSLLSAWLHTDVPNLTWNRPYVLPGYVLFFPLGDHSVKIDGRTLLAMLVLNKHEGLVAIPVTQVWSSGQWNVGLCDILLMPPGYNYKSPDVNEAAKLIAKLAINSWYTHLHEPELITTDPVRPVGGSGFGRRGKQARSPIAPTWIGRDFKLQRQQSSAGAGEGRLSVRPHWRSGHWHTVRYGKGREHTRTQWYRPVYVNASTE